MSKDDIKRLFKRLPAEAVQKATLALAKPGSLRQPRTYGLPHEEFMEFFEPGNPDVENRILAAAKTQFLNRSSAPAPGMSSKEYRADVRRWIAVGGAWRQNKQTEATLAAWKQAHLFDLRLPNTYAIPAVSEQILFRMFVQRFEHEQERMAIDPNRTTGTMSGMSGTTPGTTPGPAVDPDKRYYLLKENRENELTAEIWDAAEKKRFQNVVNARRAMIAETVDCPPVTAKLSRRAFFFYRDLKRLIVPMKGRKIYFVTMAGTEAKVRTARLRKTGWMVIWVTSAVRMAGGGKGKPAKAIADSPHTHMMLIPPYVPRVRRRNGTSSSNQNEMEIKSEQMAEDRAIAAIWRALQPRDGKLDINVLRSKTDRLKEALYFAINCDEPFPGSRGARFGMPKKEVARLTLGEKKLLHPRFTRAQMASWHQAIETTRRRYRYPIHGPRRWVWRRREEITAEALRIGPDWAIYAETIPDALKKYISSQFAITAALEDGLEYVIEFNGLHNFNCGGGGLVGLETIVSRLMQPSEIVTDSRWLALPPGSDISDFKEPWGLPFGWPAILLQLLGIHAEVPGT